MLRTAVFNSASNGHRYNDRPIKPERNRQDECRMLDQLILATAMVIAVVLVHLVGLAALTYGLRSHFRSLRGRPVMPLTLLVIATVGLLAIHTVEIWSYAAAYVVLGAFSGFEQALYYSTVTYTSIGYGDVLMPHEWRILGAIEGAAGIIMFGWSTAFLVSVLTQVRLIGHDWLSLEKSR
jgi:ion channel